MTQQNAALVEEAAAAAQSLQDQASELARVVSIFKLTEGEERKRALPVSTAVVAKPAVARPPVKKVAAPAAGKPAAKKVAAATTAADEWEEF